MTGYVFGLWFDGTCFCGLPTKRSVVLYDLIWILEK